MIVIAPKIASAIVVYNVMRIAIVKIVSNFSSVITATKHDLCALNFFRNIRLRVAKISQLLDTMYH